jgi:hypothetical protein
VYRIIEDSFWDDPQIAALSKDEKIVAVCLFTNVHTRPCGVYRIAVDRIAAMTKVPAAAVLKVLRRLGENDLVYYDGTEVCIPGYIRRQRYKGPLIAKRIVSELAQVKNRSFVAKVVGRYPDFLKLGGYKPERPAAQEERFPALTDDMPTPFSSELEKPKGRRAAIAELADEIATKLKFTGGVRKAALEELVRIDPDGIEGVRAALARAVRYYETAKAEKWKSFVIARRFSKFRDFYGEAFSSDEAAAAYVEKIRTANERETRKLKREASLHVGGQRMDTGDQELPWPKFLYRLPEALEPLRNDFILYVGHRISADTITEKLLDLFKDNAEINLKERQFAESIAKKMRTPETFRRYRINYIVCKYGVPDLEDIGAKDEEVKDREP